MIQVKRTWEFSPVLYIFSRRRTLGDSPARVRSSLVVLTLAAASWRCSGNKVEVPQTGLTETPGAGGSVSAGGSESAGTGGGAGISETGGTGHGGMPVLVVVTPGGSAGMAPAAKDPVCGDGRVDVDLKEECDDGNTTSSEGCSATCTLEPGWSCPFPGVACEAAACGDGILAGKEQCDFGMSPLAGCNAMTCTVDPGYACDTMACHATVCGDAVAEGSEGCDDANHDYADGCTPDCRREPDCSGASCTTTCGDGMVLPGDTTEACDDGNQAPGDGCSPDCAVEPGYTCAPTSLAPMGELLLPVVYRDMINRLDPGGHPNFEVNAGFMAMLVPGIVGPLGTALDAEGKPAYVATPATETTSPDNGWTTNATDFSSWFRDSSYSTTVLDTLTLTETPGGSGTFVFSETEFFPLDGRGWNDPPINGSEHNYSFTTELHYWFQWAGGETLTFFGDDDVWVYVNEKLAVDIGGIHGPITTSVTLDDATNAALGLGLVAGSVYEGGEICDDGNTRLGDGCSSVCTLETVK